MDLLAFLGVQNQHTRFFSACGSVASSLPDQDIPAWHTKSGSSYCRWPMMLAVLGVQDQHFCLARSSAVRFVSVHEFQGMCVKSGCSSCSH